MNNVINSQKKKLKILAISALPLWVMGEKKGMPSIYLGIKGFIDAGHEVHFVTPDALIFSGAKYLKGDCKRKRNYEIYEGIRIYRFNFLFVSFLKKLSSIKFPFEGISKYIEIPLQFIGSTIMWFLFILFSLKPSLKIAREIKPNVVYAHNSYATLVSYIIARKYRIPNITRLYGTFLYPALSDKKLFWLLFLLHEVLSFKLPCKYLILTNDGTCGDKVAAKLAVPSKRLKFWRNGVNRNNHDIEFFSRQFKEQLGISPSQKVILSVCRLERLKGVEKLIRVVPKITGMNEQIIFLIVGDGSEKANLVRLTEELRLTRWIRFTGSVSHEEVYKYMNIADIFVSLYIRSNVGNPLLEAMTSGKCIITLNTGGTNEIIVNNKTGILLNSNKLDDLPSMIIDLLNDNRRRDYLGRNAKAYAYKNFRTWEQRIKMEVSLIENLVYQNGQIK